MDNDKLPALSHTKAIEWATEVLKQPEINTAVVEATPWSNVLKISTQLKLQNHHMLIIKMIGNLQ